VIRDREGAERTLAHWTAFERLAPLDPRVRNTLFSRALLHTKLATEADFWHAIGYYEKLLSRSDLDTSLSENVATWLGNLAETYMMVGELEKAVATYGRALEFQNRALYAFGLGVALDRLGHGAKARELVGNYATNGGIDALIADNIFFVPYGELYYYQALAYEALGEYDTAIVKYRQFIASGAHPRYQPRAVENLQRVLATRKAKGPTIRLPRKGFVF
jgi:tetratricopeptide (TPR) repeat protein